MKKTIETSKGRFIVTDMKGEVRINNVQWFIKLSEITDKQASEVIDLMPLKYDGENYKMCRDYKLPEGNYSGRLSATQSLHSLLESQGIEITQNTYIFKV